MPLTYRVRAWDWESWILVTVQEEDEEEEESDEMLSKLDSLLGGALRAAPNIQAQRQRGDGEWEEME